MCVLTCLTRSDFSANAFEQNVHVCDFSLVLSDKKLEIKRFKKWRQFSLFQNLIGCLQPGSLGQLYQGIRSSLGEKYYYNQRFWIGNQVKIFCL